MVALKILIKGIRQFGSGVFLGGLLPPRTFLRVPHHGDNTALPRALLDTVMTLQVALTLSFLRKNPPPSLYPILTVLAKLFEVFQDT